jgi:sugar/nucleoside kinase (ribokinase family)
MDSAPEVVAVGHAIVDVLAPSEDSLVASFGLDKGTMTLVDDDEAEKIYAGLGPTTEASGGSAANTAACLASLGAAVAFVGKVADDELGRVFVHDIRAGGVSFEVEPARGGPATGRSMVMVTPDGEKTMCTSLGIGGLLGPNDIDVDAIGAATVVYIEGYLCGKPETDPAVERAVSAARDGGTLVAFSGSDPSWVDLKWSALDALLERVDVLFANEAEACGLARVDTVEAALATLRDRCHTVAITLGAKGSVVAAGSQVVSVPAATVSRLVDTTGAGDSFAAGFLYGVVRDLGPEASARLGALAAGEIVGHLGARPLIRLADLMDGGRTAGP